MTNRSIEHLLRDHREIESVLDELEALLDSQKAEPRWTASHALAFAWVTRCFNESVMHHIRKEEENLFPALEEFLPRDDSPLDEWRREQADLRAQLQRMRDAGAALSAGDEHPQFAEDFQRSGRALLRLLRNHIDKQDRILFPRVARLLSPERDAEILQQLEALAPQKAARMPPASRD